MSAVAQSLSVPGAAVTTVFRGCQAVPGEARRRLLPAKSRPSTSGPGRCCLKGVGGLPGLLVPRRGLALGRIRTDVCSWELGVLTPLAGRGVAPTHPWEQNPRSLCARGSRIICGWKGISSVICLRVCGCKTFQLRSLQGNNYSDCVS